MEEDQLSENFADWDASFVGVEIDKELYVLETYLEFLEKQIEYQTSR